MSSALPPSRFATLSRPAAISALVIVALALAACLAVALLPATPVAAGDAGGGDLDLYGRLVERLRAGEGYYPAAHEELVAGGYGVQSVFNWRTPFFMSLLALLPGIAWGQGLLIAIALAAGAMAVRVIGGDGNRALALLAIPLLILTLGSAIVVPTVLFSELTAGALILLSAMAFGLRWRWLGLVAAVLALFVRELAAPYVLIAVWFAWRDRRWSELIVWLVALAGYAAWFGWHYAMVLATVLPTDPAYADSWLSFGGLGFLVRAASFNGLLTLLPLWIGALVLPLGVLGLLAWPGTVGRLLAITVVAYAALFLVVGRPVNAYWGALFTPLLTLGLLWSPAALRDLVVRPTRSS